MRIHLDLLYNHDKTEHNRTVFTFYGCIAVIKDMETNDCLAKTMHN